MVSLKHIAVGAGVALTLGLAPARAADEFTKARSRTATVIDLCDPNVSSHTLPGCKDGVLNELTRRLETTLKATLAKAAPTTVPLLKRDQVWFRDMLASVAEYDVPDTDKDEEQEAIAERLLHRIAALEAMAAGFGRPWMTGRWENAFGSVVVTSVDGDGLKVDVETRAVYGPGSEKRRECRAQAFLHENRNGWRIGTLEPADAESDASTAGGDAGKATPADPAPQPRIKVVRQGQTLRVVAYDETGPDADAKQLGCNGIDQITGSYFAIGNDERRLSTPALVAPSFDCVRPQTATDEEICADPELAENDVKLNRAWKTLTPRLDAATRKNLTLDQRGYVRSQTGQYPQFLHPAWEKQRGHMHHTGDGRDKLARLQRERIAVLEGFDENRRGFEGLWMSYTAILKVTREDGLLVAQGWKWEQGDWKAGCGYDMKGRVTGGVFRSEQQRKNPDTLDRDLASLIVNRQDDVFAKRRWQADGTPDFEADQPKCQRNIGYSSTARLFPVRPSPDIDNIGGSIR